MLDTSKMFIGLVVLISICSFAAGTLKYVPPSQSKCRQCSARELQAGRSVRGGRKFFGDCCNTGPTCTCGTEGTAAVSSRNDDIDDLFRIMGGLDTGVNQYPWMAGLIRSDWNTRIWCGATLVAAEFVVTTAYCLRKDNFTNEALPLDPSLLTVVLGEHDTDSETETDIRKEVGVSKIIMNPTYNPRYSRNSRIGDIAVLKLDEAVDLEVYTPVCLPAYTDTWTDGQAGLVTGWGLDIESDSFTESPTLERVEVDIQTLATCDAAYTADGANPGSIGTGNVCAGLTGSRPCYYDVGGPLTTMEGNQHKLVGAVSGGICNLPPLGPVPSTFTDVAIYRRWLDDTFSVEGGATFCSN